MNSIPALMEIEKYIIARWDNSAFSQGKVIINLNLVLNISKHKDADSFYCVQMVSSEDFYITEQTKNQIFDAFKIHADYWTSKETVTM